MLYSIALPVLLGRAQAGLAGEETVTLWPPIRDRGRAAALLLLFGAIAGAASAQSSGHAAPQVGQPGKDVVWVPTPERAVERMLAMAQVGANDFVIDLGSGDGRIVIMAAQRFGARALGVELNRELVRLSVDRAKQAGVSDRVAFVQGDLFETDLRPGTVITLYLLNELNLRLRPRLLKLAPGTRIVANAFDMGEWEADQLDDSTVSLLRLWIVPARVAGSWRWSLDVGGRSRRHEMELNQQFQRVSGVISVDQQRLRLRNARLNSDELRFTIVESQRADQGMRYDYAGRVLDDRIEGEVVINESGKRLRWAATRVSPGAADRKP